MSQVAAEVKIKLIFVLVEKKLIQPHSELNALEFHWVPWHGRASYFTHINSLTLTLRGS